jgi:hypothetical protein
VQQESCLDTVLGFLYRLKQVFERRHLSRINQTLRFAFQVAWFDFLHILSNAPSTERANDCVPGRNSEAAS